MHIPYQPAGGSYKAAASVLPLRAARPQHVRLPRGQPCGRPAHRRGSARPLGAQGAEGDVRLRQPDAGWTAFQQQVAELLVCGANTDVMALAGDPAELAAVLPLLVADDLAGSSGFAGMVEE